MQIGYAGTALRLLTLADQAATDAGGAAAGGPGAPVGAGGAGEVGAGGTAAAVAQAAVARPAPASWRAALAALLGESRGLAAAIPCGEPLRRTPAAGANTGFFFSQAPPTRGAGRSPRRVPAYSCNPDGGESLLQLL